MKIAIVFGTRPEAIKMAPLIKEAEKINNIETIVINTGQHLEMVDDVLKSLDIEVDFNLEVMNKASNMSEMMAVIIQSIGTVLNEVEPDIVLVHGDTISALSASFAAFYNGISIGHVEAGLRTWDKKSPFPEEMNRVLIDEMSDIYFAPTDIARDNLAKTLKNQNVFVTGNTVIDVLKYTVEEDYTFSNIKLEKFNNKIILLTTHRRENLGHNMSNIFEAVNSLLRERKDIEVIFPIHPNPKIRKLASEKLIDSKRLHIVEPLNIMEFHNIMAKSYLILTDSGGIQEEAPALGKPVLVLRDTTERPEALQAGTIKLVGTSEESIVSNVKSLLDDKNIYAKMSNATNPYGDGNASKKILENLLKVI